MGEWLAFMSERSLTGYDNRDAASGEPDEEVYLYDAARERLAARRAIRRAPARTAENTAKHIAPNIPLAGGCRGVAGHNVVGGERPVVDAHGRSGKRS